MTYSWGKTEQKRTQEVTSCRENVFRRNYGQAVKDNKFTGPMKKAKRFRIAFTTDQLNSLEREFRKYPYVGGVRRREIADELLISERAIKIWFQNRRMKEKRENSNKETDGEEQNQLQADFSKDHIHNVGGITYNELQSLPTLPVSNENVTDIKINKELAEDLRTKSKLTVSEGNAIITPSNPDVTVSKATCDPSHERKQIADNSHGSNFVLSPGYLKSECSGLQCLPNSLAADEQHLSTCKLNKAQHPQQTYTKPLDRSRKYSERTGVDSEHSHHLKDNSNYITSETLNWNPITVAPIMSSRIPSATTSNSGIGTYSMTPPQIMPNRTCCCDCHLNYPSSHVVVQTNTFTQPVQYEINPVLFHRFPPNKK